MIEIKPLDTEGYLMPTRITFGRGSFGQVKDIREVEDARKLIVICGEHFKKSDEFGKLTKDLGEKVMPYNVFFKKSTFSTINSFSQFCKENIPDLIIAIGGGSILDTGKSGAVLATNGGKVEDYVQSKTKTLKEKGITFIAVPTTAGTGSEVTPWATVWGNDNLKYSLSSRELMFPSVAIVDSVLTDKLPKEVTAESGIDALTQAIEAYWSVKHNPISDEYALDAIKIIMKNLKKAVNKPDKDTRDKMSFASLKSGLAFSNTQTTICHSVSYPITAHWHVSHGQAVSITLPPFIEYILPVVDKFRRDKLLGILDVSNEKEASREIRKLMYGIGLKTKLSDLGISKEGLETIIYEGYNPDRAKNAPRVPSNEELKEILLSIF